MGECNTVPSAYKMYNIAYTHQFADKSMYMTQNLKLILERVEKIVRKGEMLVSCYQHFLLLLECFQIFLLRLVNSGLYGNGLKVAI